MPGGFTPNAINALTLRRRTRFRNTPRHECAYICIIWFFDVPHVKQNVSKWNLFLQKKPALRPQRLRGMRICQSRSALVEQESSLLKNEALSEEALLSPSPSPFSCPSPSLSFCLLYTQSVSSQWSATSMEDGPYPHTPQRSFWGMDPWLQTVRSFPPGLSRGRPLAKELNEKKKKKKKSKI